MLRQFVTVTFPHISTKVVCRPEWWPKLPNTGKAHRCQRNLCLQESGRRLSARLEEILRFGTVELPAEDDRKSVGSRRISQLVLTVDEKTRNWERTWQDGDSEYNSAGAFFTKAGAAPVHRSHTGRGSTWVIILKRTIMVDLNPESKVRSHLQRDKMIQNRGDRDSVRSGKASELLAIARRESTRQRDPGNHRIVVTPTLKLERKSRTPDTHGWLEVHECHLICNNNLTKMH